MANLTKEHAEIVVKECEGKKDRIVKTLCKEGFKVTDCTVKNSPFFNLKIWNEDKTMIRIFFSFRKVVEVQRWTHVAMKYSGIPVFEPGGRDTLHKENIYKK